MKINLDSYGNYVLYYGMRNERLINNSNQRKGKTI